MLNWREDFDDDDNSKWDAPSLYHDDGSPFMFRLIQILRNDCIWWESRSDDECGGPLDGPWSTLDEAKLSCEAANAVIANECANEA
jgi:hypothetical protein